MSHLETVYEQLAAPKQATKTAPKTPPLTLLNITQVRIILTRLLLPCKAEVALSLR